MTDGWSARVAFRDLVSLGRYDRPIGIWLLMWPCWWSIALAQPDGRSLLILLVLFLIGASAARAGGCAWNDLVDRKVDRKVARTKDRPLAAGRLGTRTAIVYIVVHFLVCAGILFLLPLPAVLVLFLSVPFVAVYPFAKRFTWWPQIWLGVAFSWGALAGWVAAEGVPFATPSLLLYAAGIAWTVGYDTLYAYQDRKGDVAVGIRSSAVVLGHRGIPFVALCYSLSLVLLGLSLLSVSSGWVAWMGLAGFAGFLAFSLAKVDLDDPASCLRGFRVGHPAALMFFVGLAADLWFVR